MMRSLVTGAAGFIGSHVVDELLRIAHWARGAGSRRGRPFKGIEVRRNLPASWQELESGD